jgi:hypothetical protein
VYSLRLRVPVLEMPGPALPDRPHPDGGHRQKDPDRDAPAGGLLSCILPARPLARLAWRVAKIGPVTTGSTDGNLRDAAMGYTAPRGPDRILSVQIEGRSVSPFPPILQAIP